MQNYESDSGITVKKLKEILKDWPEVDESGNPTEVWLETGRMLSSICMSVDILNRRGKASDICLNPSEKAWVK